MKTLQSVTTVLKAKKARTIKIENVVLTGIFVAIAVIAILSNMTEIKLALMDLSWAANCITK